MNKVLDSSLYRIIHQNMPINCVDVVLKTTDRGFLMIKRKEEPAKDQWWLPGGRVLRNESLVSAAKRKVLEETNLRIKSLDKIVNGYELLFRGDPFDHGGGTHSICTCYSAEVKDLSSLKMDECHSESKVFSHYISEWHPYLRYCLGQAGYESDDFSLSELDC